MKRQGRKIVSLFLCFLILYSLTGCSIGKYKVFECFTDENGDEHFMLFGQLGPQGGVEESDTSSEPVNETPTDDSSGSIEGNFFKRGWTSSDNSILKGKKVTVHEDSTLLSINLTQDKELTISYNIILDSGEYQLIHINPDGTEQLLQDGKIIQSEEQVIFEEGQNEIVIVSNNAIFKEIDISVSGINVSDFE